MVIDELKKAISVWQPGSKNCKAMESHFAVNRRQLHPCPRDAKVGVYAANGGIREE
jgi:hypothetical protein